MSLFEYVSESIYLIVAAFHKIISNTLEWGNYDNPAPTYDPVTKGRGTRRH